MKSHQLQDARAAFSRLVDDALKGEPQRVTRRGKDAVVIVSEVEWNRRAPANTRPPPTSFAEMVNNRTLSEDDLLTEEEWSELMADARKASTIRNPFEDEE